METASKSLRQDRFKIIVFEVASAFWVATFSFRIFLSEFAHFELVRFRRAPAPHIFTEFFLRYWIYPCVAVFVILWPMQNFFMKGLWNGRDLRGMSWIRFIVVLIGTLIVYLGLWNFT